jgi:hypothetical protein
VPTGVPSIQERLRGEKKRRDSAGPARK